MLQIGNSLINKYYFGKETYLPYLKGPSFEVIKQLILFTISWIINNHNNFSQQLQHIEKEITWFVRTYFIPYKNICLLIFIRFFFNFLKSKPKEEKKKG